MNPVTGHQRVEINGKYYTVRFDWAALAEIAEAHGDNPNMFSPLTVASVAAIGMRKHHPDITAAFIYEKSPPLIPFADAIQTALKWAYFGSEEVPEDTTQKKSPPRGGWWPRIRRRLRMA